MANQTENTKLTKQDIKKVYIRNLFAFQFGWNYEKMQGLGYAYVIMPVLKRLYKNDPEKMKKALKMQLSYFNTTPAMAHLIAGADMALEEELGVESEETVMAVKTGLMGPLAGVGDTLFIAIYRAIVFSIAAYIAMQGNPVGLVIPLITCAAVLWVRYKFTWIGYNSGRKLATSFADKLAPITEAASILGLTVVGTLIPSVISYKTEEHQFHQADLHPDRPGNGSGEPADYADLCGWIVLSWEVWYDRINCDWAWEFCHGNHQQLPADRGGEPRL